MGISKTRVYTLNSVVYLEKHKGKTIKQIADEDKQYLLWLHQSIFRIKLGKTVLEYLGVWNNYKNTQDGRDPRILTK